MPRVMSSVMEPAQEQQVVEVRSTTQRPVLIVMSLGAMSRHATTRESTESIPNVKRESQPFRHDALLAADVDR